MRYNCKLNRNKCKFCHVRPRVQEIGKLLRSPRGCVQKCNFSLRRCALTSSRRTLSQLSSSRVSAESERKEKEKKTKAGRRVNAGPRSSSSAAHAAPRSPAAPTK